jgi:transposase
MPGMAPNFIECDREQAFLMPPSLHDWVAEDHLVWTILEAVEEMDLSGFYADYRADGHGRPAYDPKMMVALLLYAYAKGNRSSRGIERECQEDVAYRVICSNLVPDHSTIAEFRVRHEAALGEVFTSVLSLCRTAGLVRVGVVAVDGTKIAANAARTANRSYEQIAREILAEAAETDRREDELYGDARGDELPERLRTSAGRRAALREAKEELERERATEHDAEARTEARESVAIEFDPARFVARAHGRRAWLREGRRALEERRALEARPVARSRAARLEESARRLEEELVVERQANAAYEAWRRRGVAVDGTRRMAPGSTKPYRPPELPAGTINTTDPDSRLVKTVGQKAIQGYNAQAAVNEHQILVACEVTVDSPDFGHLEPMVDATERELATVGAESPGVVIADAGYWHKRQMENVVSRGIQVLIPPDSGLRTSARPGWDGGLYAFMRRVLSTDHAKALYRKRHATIEPVFGQMKFNRRFDRFLRRGRSAVRSEWRLFGASHNLLKLHNHRTATTAA